MHTRPRIDPLACVALAGAALACCPAAAIGGLIAGVISLARVRASRGAIAGRGLAIGSMIACVVLGTISWRAGTRFQGAGQTAMSAEVRAAVDQLLASELDPSAWWVQSDPRALLVFQRDVRQRLGPLSAAGVTQVELTAGYPARAQYRVLVESPRVQAFASVEVDIGSDFRSLLPTVRLRSISIAPPDDDSSDNSPPPLAYSVPSDHGS